MAMPEWTKKHKRKGVYVGKNSTGYFLYSAKSVYDPELKRGKMVDHVYLGAIYEDRGFVPKTKKSDKFKYINYGLPYIIYTYCHRDLSRYVYNDSLSKKEMVCAAILYFCYRRISIEDLKQSILATYFPEIDFSVLSENRVKRVIILSRRINSWWERTVNDQADRDLLICLLSQYPALIENKQMIILNPCDQLSDLLKKYNLEVVK